jgi:hypothetical protein
MLLSLLSAVNQKTPQNLYKLNQDLEGQLKEQDEKQGNTDRR